MGDKGLRQLYLARSIKELNEQVKDIPKAQVKLLVNTAQKLLKEAQSIDKKKDEEKAYILYMRYFSVIRIIQGEADYKKNKKYYDGLLDPKMTRVVINRAEELQESLARRYELKNDASRAEKIAEERRLAEMVAKEKEIEKKLKKREESKEIITNGVSEEGYITCQKLYSLSQEKCSTYMILDTRPRNLFLESQIKLPYVINIPEEILKPGLTAGRIGCELEDSSRSLWMTRRDTVDYLILCDWCTEKPPLPQSLNNLIDAIVKWDPGKKYKSEPLILKGGFELWCLMYPVLVTNPRAVSHYAKTENRQESVLLNFEYPDLDTAFIETPSPNPARLPVSPPEIRSTATSVPTVNRNLKPAFQSKDLLDGKNNNINNFDSYQINNNATVTDSSSRISLGSKVNSWETKDSNIALDLGTLRQNSLPSEKVDNVPSVPSRSLKPKELLENLAAKKMELEQEQELLEESVKVEEDTMQKMKEMEETTVKREHARDEQSRAQLRETEERLHKEIQMLKTRSSEMEERYNNIHKQNEELWRMVNLVLSGSLSNVSVGPSSTTELAEIKQKQEQEQLRAQEDKRRALQEQVESMRKERKEKERKLKEQAEKERKALEQAEAERRQAEERKSRVEAELRTQKNKGSVAGTGETYTTRLRDSPRSSPVRGGSNLKRSHSAFNLSQLGDDDKDVASSPVANFDRSLKPLNAPQRRNINAARQRNFEPKYGNVGHARTGLKNLGNTCYMNSIIQCLNNTTVLAKYFVESIYSDDINSNSKHHGDVAEEVGAVFRALWCGQYRSIAMWDLKNAVGRYHKPFQGYDQQDAHEFLIKLMDWLHEDLNKVTGKKHPMKEQNYDDIPDYVAAEKLQEELKRRDDSVMCSIFHGLHRSVIECGTCSHRSLTFEPFSIISLSFPSNGRCTLRELLQHYYKDSNIEYKCSKCKKVRGCVRKLDIWKSPPVLILHLNRFEHDVLMKKKQNYVDFPLENIDLSKHTAMKNVRYTNYDLYGVSNHYGTMDGGHYTAFCKSSVNKSWYKFDDHEVYELSRDSVRSSAAYLLFYEASNMNVKLNNLL